MDSLVEKPPIADASAAPLATPAALAGQLRRAALPIGVCALLGAAGAYVYTTTLPKVYTADGLLAVEGDRMAIPELQGALRNDNTPDPLPQVHTEVQALSARQLVQQVTMQLHLDRDPEFNAALRPPTVIGNVKDFFKRLLPAGAPDKHTDSAQAAQDALVGAVQHSLSITQDNRSLVIGLGFNAHDPALAANFVNTLIADYIAERASRRVNANQGASTVISQRIDQVRGEIAGIEQQMRDLRSKSGVVGTRAGSVGQQQVESLANAASQATLDRSQIEANYDRAAALAAGGSSDALASVLGSETISRLRGQESEAASKVADLDQRYGPAYPALRSARADLAAARAEIAGEARRIVASLATQLKVARAHEADVLGQLAAARKEGISAQNTQAELDQLQQDATTRRDLYRNLLERAQQTSSQPTGTETPDVRVLSRATAPGLPSGPSTKLAAAFGGMSGALLAAVAALAFTRRTSLPVDAAAFARGAGLHVLAGLRGRAAARGLAERVLADPNGADAVALRTARTRAGQVSRTPARVVGFVGGQPGVAASNVACAFARVAAHDGQRVLLIDQDPAGGAMLRVLGEPGGRVAEVMSGEAAWRDCVVADKAAGLDTLLGAAKSAPVPQRGIVWLENLLAEAREEYDQIVLGAPFAAESEATRVVRSSDMAVVVLDEVSMREAAAGEACTRLRGLSRSPLAAILISRG